MKKIIASSESTSNYIQEALAEIFNEHQYSVSESEIKHPIDESMDVQSRYQAMLDRHTKIDIFIDTEIVQFIFNNVDGHRLPVSYLENLVNVARAVKDITPELKGYLE